jgi:hypothetical protein
MCQEIDSEIFYFFAAVPIALSLPKSPLLDATSSRFTQEETDFFAQVGAILEVQRRCTALLKRDVCVVI